MSSNLSTLVFIIFIVLIGLLTSKDFWRVINKKIDKKREERKKEKFRNELLNDYHQSGMFLPYVKKSILTNNERNFYISLRQCADKYNLEILTKIRLADIVDVSKEISWNERQTYFNKIQSKHIDFAIHEHMNIILAIELDDSSHEKLDRIERDMFVNGVLEKCGYKIIHTHGELYKIEEVMRNYRERS